MNARPMIVTTPSNEKLVFSQMYGCEFYSLCVLVVFWPLSAFLFFLFFCDFLLLVVGLLFNSETCCDVHRCLPDAGRYLFWCAT